MPRLAPRHPQPDPENVYRLPSSDLEGTTVAQGAFSQLSARKPPPTSFVFAGHQFWLLRRETEPSGSRVWVYVATGEPSYRAIIIPDR